MLAECQLQAQDFGFQLAQLGACLQPALRVVPLVAADASAVSNRLLKALYAQRVHGTFFEVLSSVLDVQIGQSNVFVLARILGDLEARLDVHALSIEIYLYIDG